MFICYEKIQETILPTEPPRALTPNCQLSVLLTDRSRPLTIISGYGLLFKFIGHNNLL